MNTATSSDFNYTQRVDSILTAIFTKGAGAKINRDIVHAAEFGGVIGAARQCGCAAGNVIDNSIFACSTCNTACNACIACNACVLMMT